MRVATYNVKHCGLQGRDGILAVLRSIGADLVGLQEVDVGVRRSGSVDQAALLAGALGLHTAFGPAFPYEGGEYGVALLSRWPIHAAETIPLPAPGEPRALLLAEVEHPEGRLQVAVTHLGLDPAERIAQTRLVAERLRPLRRVVLVGDFNASHSEISLRPLHGFLVDTALQLGRAPLRSYPASAPTIGIDHVFVSRDLPAPRQVAAVPGLASDHLPVVAELG